MGTVLSYAETYSDLSDEASRTLQDMRPRCPGYQGWLRKGDVDDDDEALEEFLESEHGITVRDDGRVEFDHLTARNRKIIGDHPVVLNHHTSDALEESILERGLLRRSKDGVPSTNPHVNSGAGVYLTTEHTGPVVDGYHSVATGMHGGGPRTFEVEAYLDELQHDPDDEDLSVGKRQFVAPSIAPDKILNALRKEGRPELYTPMSYARTPGETMTKNGVTYVLNENHRWASQERSPTLANVSPHETERSVGKTARAVPAAAASQKTLEELRLSHLLKQASDAGIMEAWDSLSDYAGIEPNPHATEDYQALKGFLESHDGYQKYVNDQNIRRENANLARDRIKDRIGYFIEESGLEPEAASQYQKASESVLDYMTHDALRLFARNVQGINYHGNLASLQKSHHKMSGRDASNVGGFWSWHPSEDGGDLHLDGGHDTDEHTRFTVRHLYAHEFAHAIDGQQKLSTQPDWVSAWEYEIKTSVHPPSEYSQTNAVEGFAEFGRLVLTSPADARENYPDCYDFWKKNGIAQ